MSESLGIDVFWVRLCVFVLAAALAGIAGWLYAHMTRFVSPAPFALHAGIEYLLMAVLGGAGTIAGAVVGAASVALAEELAAGSVAASVRPTAPTSKSWCSAACSSCCCTSRAAASCR